MGSNDWVFIALGLGGLAVVGFLFKDEIMGFFQGGIPPDLEEPVGGVMEKNHQKNQYHCQHKAVYLT